MNTSIELCKELDKFSGGWGRESEGENTNRFFWVQDGGDASVANRYQLLFEGKEEYPIICPMYELSYLLRKLPRIIEYYKELYFMIEPDPLDTQWAAQYVNEDYILTHKKMSAMAQTPEDAVAMLLIELFKQGVLTK